MPVYEYGCPDCGDFTALMPLARYREPQPCPACGEPSPRVVRSAPGLPLLRAETRKALAINERSAHAPKLSTAGERESAGKHGPSCACCKPGHSARTRQGADGAKSFPGRRPWMISH
jgi:putative FmdB family regulatory protein